MSKIKLKDMIWIYMNNRHGEWVQYHEIVKWVQQERQKQELKYHKDSTIERAIRQCRTEHAHHGMNSDGRGNFILEG